MPCQYARPANVYSRRPPSAIHKQPAGLVEQNVSVAALQRTCRTGSRHDRVLIFAGQIEESAHAVVGSHAHAPPVAHAAADQVAVPAALFDEQAPGAVIGPTEAVRAPEIVDVVALPRVNAQHDAQVPGRAAVVERARRGVAVIAAVINEQPHAVMSAGAVAVAGGAVLIVAVH